MLINFLLIDSMGPKKSGARKRKTEEDLEGEGERGDGKRKNRGNKKYIGAHVGISGEA